MTYEIVKFSPTRLLQVIVEDIEEGNRQGAWDVQEVQARMRRNKQGRPWVEITVKSSSGRGKSKRYYLGCEELL